MQSEILSGTAEPELEVVSQISWLLSINTGIAKTI